MSHDIVKVWETQSGLRAVVIHVHRSLRPGGHYCGYVGVPVGHFLHGVEYNHECDGLSVSEDQPIGARGVMTLLAASCADSLNRPEFAFDVHGGLTFSGNGNNYPTDGDEWWFGFDCAHADDDPTIHNEAYVLGECERLADQIVAVTST